MTDVLEIFISLLRNKANTRSVDVELFFADHPKLVSKMSKNETTSVSLDLVNNCSKSLEEKRGNFQKREGDSDISAFAPFFEWSWNFCEAAKVDLALLALFNEVENLQLKRQRAEIKVARFDNMFRDAD